jgi:hypothetical protein
MRTSEQGGMCAGDGALSGCAQLLLVSKNEGDKQAWIFLCSNPHCHHNHLFPSAPPATMPRAVAILLVLFLALSLAPFAAAKITSNLPPDAPLRVGVLSRPADCSAKAKSGDKLSMHYTGTLVRRWLRASPPPLLLPHP